MPKTDHHDGMTNAEILCGFHSVQEALRAGRRQIVSVLIAKGKKSNRLDRIRDLAAHAGLPVRETASAELDRLSAGIRHQGVAARSGPYPLPAAGARIAMLAQTQDPCFILILENMEDPHNMGALIRTAVCAGADAVFIPKDRAAMPSPSVSRSSAGAMEHADIFVMTNTAATLRQLKACHVWVGGLDAGGDTELFQTDMTGRFALVVGSENKGVRPLVRKQCDFLISIPITGPVNSLNASVAGAVAMYEALRQRQRLPAGNQ